MAIIRLKNLTNYRLAVPVASVILDPQGVKDFTIIDIDEFYNEPSVQKMLNADAPKITAFTVQDSTPGSMGDAVLPFYSSGEMPPAGDNPGMMLYNTTNMIILYSDGARWLAPTKIPAFVGFPSVAAYPEPYLIFERSSKSLYFSFDSAWRLTKSAGIRSLPSHLFPDPGLVDSGTMLFDTDNRQLKVSDGEYWLLPNNVYDYVEPAGLPSVFPPSVGFGALAYTSQDHTLWFRLGGGWRPTTGMLRYYDRLIDLPTLNADEESTIAFVSEHKVIVVWDGAKWINSCVIRVYKPSDLPDASLYPDGYIIFDGSNILSYVAWSGRWEPIGSVCRAVDASIRPYLHEVPVGTCIFNTTSGVPNWSNGTTWVKADGTVDP